MMSIRFLHSSRIEVSEIGAIKGASSDPQHPHKKARRAQWLAGFSE